MAYESWRYADPSLVYERNEARAQHQTQKAITKAQNPFGDDMGRKISIPGHILNAMYDWGSWARRPQFWANLGSTPFYRLLPIPQPTRPIHEVRLDPLSHHIHKAVMRIDSDMTRAMLYVYFVREASYEDHANLFKDHKVAYTQFIDMVKAGSEEAYKRGRRTLDAQEKIYKSISM